MKKIVLVLALFGINLVFANDTMENNATNTNDITRWEYSEQDLEMQEKREAYKAKVQEEYNMSITRKRSGYFLGGGLGYARAGSDNIFEGKGLLNVNGIGAELVTGYQRAFNEYSGTRFYAGVGYNLGNGVFVASSGGKTETAKANIFKAHIDIDFYLEGSMGRNNTETLGAFLGLGGGYIHYRGSDDYKGFREFALLVNLGLHTIINNNNKVELFARVYPFVKNPTNGTANNAKFDITSNVDFMIRYLYLF